MEHEEGFPFHLHVILGVSVTVSAQAVNVVTESLRRDDARLDNAVILHSDVTGCRHSDEAIFGECDVGEGRVEGEVHSSAVDLMQSEERGVHIVGRSVSVFVCLSVRPTLALSPAVHTLETKTPSAMQGWQSVDGNALLLELNIETRDRTEPQGVIN